MTKPNRILVFGQNGQMARALADMPGLDIISLGREEADLTDPTACAQHIAQTDASLVINAAAYTNVDGAESDQETAELVNATTPTAMAQAAAARNLPFVSISTDYVFDGLGDTARAPGAPIQPLGVYGATKSWGEQGICAAGGLYGVIRTSWVFSAQGSNFVKTMLTLAQTRDSLTVIDDQVGGPTEATDLAHASVALAMALAEGRALPGIYHFAGAPDVSWAGFAREIFAQSGSATTVSSIATDDYPARPAKRPLNSRLDCTSFTEATGMERPDWRISLARVLNELN
ncbi:MAG: dTDP-4-dehydrorhamnose reductase [Paracoccaceae bacterium]